MKRLGIFTALSMLLVAFTATVALATVYTPTNDSFNSANAPASSHLASGSPSCTVNADNSINCSSYVLGGVGGTPAAVSLSADYSATIDCTNKGGNLVESHTATFSATHSDSATPDRHGQLPVRAVSVSPFSTQQVCPNPNWNPSIRRGVVTLNSFKYTLTFNGFSAPYITI